MSNSRLNRTAAGQTAIKLLIICFTAFAAGRAMAVDWASLIQPRGTVVTVRTAADANAILSLPNPPYDNATDVAEIRTDRQEQFVRLYNPSAGSNQIGSWIVRARFVRGLTPEEIRDKLALPAVPTHITNVVVPAGENGGAPTGTVIWTGIAAPVAGWGSGGGQQSQLRGTWIPSGSYRNGQLLGAQALVYTPSAGKGSAGRVAVYLDAAIPQAYSDLEDVYIALDFLNYGDKGPLQAALTGISPLVLESLTDVATRGAWRMNKAIRDRALGDGTRKTAVWADGARESLSREDSGEHAGYSAKTDAVYAGAELRQSPEASAGICAGSSRSRVDWLSGNGSASRDSRRLGFYWERRGRALRLLGSLGAGWAQARVDRGISFSGADRIAHSDQYDHDLSGQLQAEYTLNVSGWDVRPAAGLEYTYLVIGDFTESGAGRLNLSVKKRMPLTFRGSLGLGLSKALPAGAGWTMRPGLRFGWANEAPLDDRAITAVMSGRPDGFSVDGRKGPVDSFWLGFGMSVSKGAFLAYVRCEGELGRGFNANAAKAGVTLRF